MSHSAINENTEYYSANDAFRDSGIEFAAAKVGCNMAFARAELIDKKPILELAYTHVPSDFIARHGEKYSNLIKTEPPKQQEILLEGPSRLNDPRVQQVVIVSADDPGQKDIVGDRRGYIYIYTRDPKDPSRIKLLALEAPADIKELRALLKALGLNDVPIGKEGERYLFSVSALTDNPITFERIMAAAKAVSAEYGARIAEYFDNRPAILAAMERLSAEYERRIVSGGDLKAAVSAIVRDLNTQIEGGQRRAVELYREQYQRDPVLQETVRVYRPTGIITVGAEHFEGGTAARGAGAHRAGYLGESSSEARPSSSPELVAIAQMSKAFPVVSVLGWGNLARWNELVISQQASAFENSKPVRTVKSKEKSSESRSKLSKDKLTEALKKEAGKKGLESSSSAKRALHKTRKRAASPARSPLSKAQRVAMRKVRAKALNSLTLKRNTVTLSRNRSTQRALLRNLKSARALSAQRIRSRALAVINRRLALRAKNVARLRFNAEKRNTEKRNTQRAVIKRMLGVKLLAGRAGQKLGISLNKRQTVLARLRTAQELLLTSIARRFRALQARAARAVSRVNRFLAAQRQPLAGKYLLIRSVFKLFKTAAIIKRARVEFERFILKTKLASERVLPLRLMAQFINRLLVRFRKRERNSPALNAAPDVFLETVSKKRKIKRRSLDSIWSAEAEFVPEEKEREKRVLVSEEIEEPVMPIFTSAEQDPVWYLKTTLARTQQSAD